DQSIPYADHFSKLFASFQSALKAGSDTPINIYSEQLEYSHFKGAEYNDLLRTFIKEKYRSKPIGVIVADGFDALQFAVSLGTEVDPAIPIVFSSVDDSSAAELNDLQNVTGTMVRRSIRQALIAAKALVPGLKQIAVVGDPLDEQTYRRHYKNELLAIGNDVEFIDLTGLPMNELHKRVATLPANAAIFYTTLSVGSDGTRYDPNDALALLAEVANRDRSGKPTGTRWGGRIPPSGSANRRDDRANRVACPQRRKRLVDSDSDRPVHEARLRLARTETMARE